MQKSPFAPIYSDIYWYRPLFLKYSTLIVFILGIGEGIISAIVGADYTIFSMVLGFWGLICYFFSWRKKIEIGTSLLLTGLSAIIAYRSYEVHSAMNANYLAILLIAAAILLNMKYVMILFVFDLLFSIYSLITNVFTWEQPICSDNGLFFANNIGVLIPSLILSFVIAIIISRVFLNVIQNQIKHQKLIQETQDFLIQKEKISSIQVLAGGIAHDFNNILTALIGNLELVDLEQNSIEKNKEFLDEIQAAGLKAKTLANQLLTFSKPSKLNKSQFNITQLITDTVDFTLHGRKSKVEYNFSKDNNQICADKEQLGRVIQNIVLNADQAMPNGGLINIEVNNAKIVSIYRNTVQPGEYIHISIQDHGIGMTPDQLKHLFEPFYTTKKEGTGLGLAISYSIIANHNGYILLDSQPGVGTQFDIYIPLTEIIPINESKTKDIIPRYSGEVLIVDDDQKVQKTLQNLLEKLGFSVKYTNNGRDAIKIVEDFYTSNRKFEFVILDLTLPGEIGGHEIIKEIHSRAPAIKGIISSGYSRDNILENFRDYGFSAVLPKPYTLHELIEVIKAIKLKE